MNDKHLAKLNSLEEQLITIKNETSGLYPMLAKALNDQ